MSRREWRRRFRLRTRCLRPVLLSRLTHPRHSTPPAIANLFHALIAAIERQIRQFFFTEHLPDLFINLIRHVPLADIRHHFRPTQGRAFPIPLTGDASYSWIHSFTSIEM